MAQGVTDGLVQGVVAADVLALEQKLSVLCQKAAVGGEGLTVEGHTRVEAVGQVKDLICLPGNGSHRFCRLPSQKIIV